MVGNQHADATVAQVRHDALDVGHGYRVDTGEWFVERGVKMGLPERESWRMAFGLLVTLIWLYLEILRLLAIIASSRD